MVTGALKKIATASGMKIEKGYVYGEVDGYLMMVEDVGSYRKLFISLPIDLEDTRRVSVEEFIEQNKRVYTITSYKIYDTYIEVLFYNTIGSKKKFEEFLIKFPVKLKELGIPSGAVCSVCAVVDDRAVKKVKTNNPVLYMHDDCCLSLSAAASARNEVYKSEEKNHLSGAIGATIGGIVGSIPWIIVYLLGYFVGWLGFVIGIAANKGYQIFKGKSSKAKPLIILLVVIVCVVLATFVSEGISLVKVYSEYGYTDLSISDIISELLYHFNTNSEFRGIIIKNIVLGLVFAGLGVFQLLRGMAKESKDLSFVVLE